MHLVFAIKHGFAVHADRCGGNLQVVKWGSVLSLVLGSARLAIPITNHVRSLAAKSSHYV
jgi:hypothetical protein